MHRGCVLLAGALMAAMAAGCTETAPAPEQENAVAEAPAAGDPPEKVDPPAKPAPAAPVNAAPEIQAAYWINTDPLSLADLRGNLVVLEFWATWCPPCRTTIPHLIKMYNEHKNEGVVFVSLTNEPREKVEPFVEKMGMPYPIGGGSPSGRAYAVRGIPHAFIISPAGEVVWEGHPMGGLQEAIETHLEATPPTK